MKQLPTEDYCYRVPAIRQKGEKNSTANQPEDEFVNLLHVDSLNTSNLDQYMWYHVPCLGPWV